MGYIKNLTRNIVQVAHQTKGSTISITVSYNMEGLVCNGKDVIIFKLPEKIACDDKSSKTV